MDQSWTEFLTGGPQCLPMCDRGRGANDAGADGWPPGIHMLLWCHIENKPKFHRSVSRRWCKSDSSITKRKCSFSSSTQLLLFKRDIGSCYSPQHPRRHWGNECQNAGKRSTGCKWSLAVVCPCPGLPASTAERNDWLKWCHGWWARVCCISSRPQPLHSI